MKNTFVKVLSFVMALMMVVGTFGTLAVFAADCTHENAVAGEKVPATCSEFGYTWYACSCGESFKDDFVNPTGKHVEKDYYYDGTSANATCTQPGYKAGKQCVECKVVTVAPVEDDKKPAQKHKFGEGTYKAGKLCTDATVVEYLCSICGKSADTCKTEDAKDGTYDFATEEVYNKYATITVVAAGTHSWNEYVVTETPADACAPVSLERTCKNCSAKETVKTEESHNWVAKSNKEEGENYCGAILSYEECSKCGDIRNEKPNTDVKHNHTLVPAVTDELKNNAKFVNFCNKNGYHYLTLAAGTPLTKAASCSATGVKVYECNDCGEFTQETVAKLDHVITYTTVVGDYTNKADKDCKTATKVVATCANYATCKYQVTVEVVAAAKAHKVVEDKDNSKAATCTTSGVAVTKCETCGVKMSETYTAPLGHSFGAAFNCDATGKKVDTVDCTKGIYTTKACTRKDCGALDTIVTVLAPQTNHNMTNGSDYKVKPATCVENTYGYYYCQNGACAHTVKATGTEVANSKNPANHVPYAEGMTLLKGKRVDPTCQKTGTEYYLCACGAERTREIKKLDHVKGTYTKIGNVEYDVRAIQETCFADGQKAGELCIKCGEILKAPEKIAKNPDKHYIASTKDLVDGAWTYTATTPTPIKSVPATCIADGYDVVRYDACCDVTKNVPNNDKKADTKHVFETKEFVKPTCGVKGHETYTICKICNKIESVDLSDCEMNCGDAKHTTILAKLDAGVLTLADIEFAAKNHEFTNKVEAKPATCDENGNSEYYTCKHCDVATAYTIYRKHKRVEKEYKDQDPTCTANGYNGGMYCPICVEIKGTPDYIDAHTGVEKLGHDWNTDASAYQLVNYKRTEAGLAVVDCTVAAYTMTKCDRCDLLKVVENSFIAPKAAHNYELTVNTSNVQTTEGALDSTQYIGYACWMSGYTSKNCAVCGTPSEKTSKNDQISHYYYVAGEKKAIDTSCTEIGKYDGVHCALCNLEVKATENALEEYEVGGYIGADHNYKTEETNIKLVNENADKTKKENWVATSCTEYGRYTEYCATCKKEVVTITKAPLNATLNPMDEDGKLDANIVKAHIETVASTATTKGYIKYVCNLCGLTHQYDLPLAENFVVSGALSAETIPAGSEVTYTVKFSGAAKEFGTLTLDVAYNAAKFDVKAVDTTLAGANAYYNVNANGLGITLVVPFDVATGEEQKVATTVAGTDVVTITFVAKQYVSDEAQFNVTACSIVKTVDCKEAKLTVVGLGNVNGKDAITAEDAAAVSKYFAEDAKYDASVDFNNDGIIDIDDLALIATFVASGKTAKDYLVMLGTYSEIKTIIDALYENNELLDLDGNGIINNNDRYILTNAVDAKLATYKSYTDINFASVEELVAGVMDTLVTSKA